MIVGFLRKQYAGRMGTQSIPERVDSRIQRTVTHYMTEVAKIQGNTKPTATLNQEVVREATSSMDAWIRQQQAIETPPAQRAEVSAMPMRGTVSAANVARTSVPVGTPRVQQTIPQALTPVVVGNSNMGAAVTPGPRYDTGAVGQLFEPVAMAGKANAFQTISPDDDDDEEDPVILMKKAQKLREDEMLRTIASDEAALTNTVDPTPQAQPAPIRTAPLAQDYIIPQEPIVKYRDKEYNIFLTSSDRDWFRNRTENRYSFSVTFNSGNRAGYGLSPSVQERFRNIQRIEFVKAILPTESLTTLVRNTNTKASPTYTANRVVNCLSLPFAGVRIAELNNNGFSTNPREDNTFALVQYDATWNSNTSQQFVSGTSAPAALASAGYSAFIPKFLKAQRIYEPTPLAGLQKMTFRIERHDGSLLSTTPDVLGVQRICLSATTTGIATTNLSVYGQGAPSPYIFLQTGTYFPFSAFSEGDLVNIQGYAVAATGSGTPTDTTRTDFESYVNFPDGLYVVGIAHINAGNITDGPNAVGYANIIILRARFDDPTTGSTARTTPGPAMFGGTQAQEDELALRINAQASTASSAAIINLSRQTHLVLRVITRDMDSGSNIRPDNV